MKKAGFGPPFSLGGPIHPLLAVVARAIAMKAQLLLLASLSTSSAALAQVADNLATPASLLQYVDTSDGVSRTEANGIAEAYFLIHVGCGGYDGISELGGSWVVEGKFGFAGEPILGFRIDKQTGAIASPIGPSYSHPGDMPGPDSWFRQKPLRAAQFRRQAARRLPK